MQKVVLAYSGGLDTSVAIKWIGEKYNMEVVTLTVDVGANDRDLESIRNRAIEIGAVKALVRDVKDEFVKYFIWPALQAGAMYQGEYPLATALARPLIAWHLVQVAREEGASAVAHGCTGKGNDQVRFDISVNVLAPDLKIIAPVREWRMTRDEEIAYAHANNIPLQAVSQKHFSVDQNLWGRSIEAGPLEDPMNEPPEEAYAWTAAAAAQPDEPEYITIDFEKGIPVALNGEQLDGATLITKLNEIAGRHGVGRIDHIEDRLVGIKSREVYEAPGAMVLHRAHKWLESLTLTRDSARFKSIVANEYAELVYNGLWFSPIHQDLAAYVASSQRYVTGTIKVKLFKGNIIKATSEAPKSLYNFALATYDKGDQYNHDAAIGFINVFGLSLRNQSQIQLKGQTPDDMLSLGAPDAVTPKEEGKAGAE
jgi:argininosuccinate synthase